MPKFCPLLKDDCMETKCQLWTPLDETHSECAIVVISNALKKEAIAAVKA